MKRLDSDCIDETDDSYHNFYCSRCCQLDLVLANIRGLARRPNVRRNSLRVLKFEIGAASPIPPPSTEGVRELVACINCFHLNDEEEIACLSQSLGRY